MNCLDRWLSPALFCHGGMQTTEYRLKAWALAHNFLPFTPSSQAKRAKKANDSPQFVSRVHQLNGYVFCSNWLENLLPALLFLLATKSAITRRPGFYHLGKNPAVTFYHPSKNSLVFQIISDTNRPRANMRPNDRANPGRDNF